MIFTSTHAQQIGGMKDIKVTDKTVNVSFDVPELYKAWSVPDSYRKSDYPYTVTISSGSDKTEYFNIQGHCGEKDYEKHQVIVGAGATVSFDFNMTELLKGYQTIKIEVTSSDGKSVAAFVKNIHILPPLNNAFLEEYTRKIGISGAMAVSEADDVTQLRTHRIPFDAWAVFEPSKGKYNIGNDDNFANAEKIKSDLVVLMAYNNPIYSGSASINKGLNTKEEFDAFANYAKAIQSKYSNSTRIKYWEVFNEPNGMWLPRNTTDYAYLGEVVKRELTKSNPKEKTAIGSVANGDFSYVEESLEAGLWPNMDAVANHPYIRPTLVDELYHYCLSGMTKVITKFGGWKEQIITEVGWPTQTSGVSKEQAAIELVKQVIVADYYDIAINQYYMNADVAGRTEEDTEGNFGVFFSRDNEFKPSAYSISNLGYETVGAVFLGKMMFSDKDIEAYLYARDDKITCVIWSKAGEKTVSFEGERLTASDMNGNPAGEGNSFTIGEKPIYLHGVDKKHIANSLSENIKAYLDLYFKDCFNDSQDKKGFDDAKNLMYRTVDYAADFAKAHPIPTETEAFEGLKNHYEVSYKLIDMYKSGELEIPPAQLDGLLYLNHWGGMIWDGLCLVSADRGSLGDYKLKCNDKIKEVDDFRNKKMGENTLSYSEAIMTYSRKYAEKAAGVISRKEKNQLKSGAVKAWDEMSFILADLALKLAKNEAVGHDNVILQLPSAQSQIEVNTESVIYPSLYNYRKQSTLSGYAELVNPDGEVIALSEKIELAPGTNAKVPIKLLLTSVKEGEYRIKFIENDEVICDRKAQITGKKGILAEIENSKNTFEDIDSVKLKFTDLKGRGFTGSISVEPLCDWVLADSVDNIFSLEQGEDKSFEWKVLSKKSALYHTYPFKVIVKNEKGEEILNEIQFLNFTVIKKADEDFDILNSDGDSEFFADAYPIYVRLPKNPLERVDWFDGGYYTRMMSKWSDDYLYLLFDVFDWYHENAQVGANIWNGDSIQLAIDPLNDGGNEYKSDDFEFGFALTDYGKSVFAWKDAVTNKEEKKPEEWVNIIRDNENEHTRYMIKIPKAAVAPLSFKTGNVFGMDVLYNNSNVGTRNDYAAFADAIAHGKFPDKYWDFIFVEDKINFDNTNEPVIPGKITGSTDYSNDDRIKFSDISGHWAEDEIKNFVKRGYVHGKSEWSFLPDGFMERAEYVVMLGNVIGNIAEPGTSLYEDVTPGLWFNNGLYTCMQSGVIPEQMIEKSKFYANSSIKREEVFAMLDLYLKNKAEQTDYEQKPLSDFSDWTEVSEEYRSNLQELYSLGLLSGDENGNLNPQKRVTRAEAVSITSRVIKKMEG